MKQDENKTLVNFFLWFLGIFAVWMLGYVVMKAFKYNQLNIFNMIIPITIGVTYENLRISKKWKYTLLKIFGSLILSLMIFIESENDKGFSFTESINIWSYIFIFLLVLTSVIYHKDRVIPKITEGIILLQSISFIYWIIDIYRSNIFNKYTIIALVLPFSIFSIFHALSYIKLSRNSKLTLSIWSSFIMLIFSIHTIIYVVKNESYLQSDFESIIYNYVTYFILGVSLVYMFKNFELFLGYIPKRNRGDKNYREIVTSLNEKHISRFSEIQVKRFDSVLAIVFLSTIYGFNLSFNLINAKMLIWICFICFPIILQYKNHLFRKKMTANKGHNSLLKSKIS